eukprot:tig00001052_g6613.t1
MIAFAASPPQRGVAAAAVLRLPSGGGVPSAAALRSAAASTRRWPAERVDDQQRAGRSFWAPAWGGSAGSPSCSAGKGPAGPQEEGAGAGDSVVRPTVEEDLILFPPGTIDDPRTSKGYLAPRQFDGGPLDVALRTTETGLMSSATVLLYLILKATGGNLPLEFLFCTPLLVVGLRWGERQARMGATVTTLLMFVCFGPQSGARFLLETGATSLALVAMLRAGVDPALMIVAGSLVDLLGQLGQVALISLFLDANIFDVVTAQGAALLSTLQEAGVVPALPEESLSQEAFVQLSVLTSLEVASLSFTAATLWVFWQLNMRLFGFRVTPPPSWLILNYPDELRPIPAGTLPAAPAGTAAPAPADPAPAAPEPRPTGE